MDMIYNITIKQVIDVVIVAIGVLSVIIEFNKKISFRPISLLLSYLGKFIFQDLDKKLVEIEQQQKANMEALIELDKKVDLKFEEKQKDDDEKEAKRLRANIISFADDCRVGNNHTQTHFENIMRDYGDYVSYCEKHGLPNHYIDNEYIYIRSVYQECLKDNKFL